MKTALVALSLLWLSALACGQVGFHRDSNYFYSTCKLTERSIDGAQLSMNDLLLTMECLGFIEGAVDYDQLSGAKLCVPERVTPGQLVLVYVKFLDKHPEQLHEPAAKTLFNAISQSFKCQ